MASSDVVGGLNVNAASALQPLCFSLALLSSLLRFCLSLHVKSKFFLS